MNARKTPQAPQGRVYEKSMLALAACAALGAAQAQQARPAQDVNEVQTVIVTVQKRQQALQDVPISMTVVGADTLEKSRSSSLEDMQQLVPSFSIENQSGLNVLTVRGVGGGGRNIGFDPRVSVYVDGIYMGQAQALRQPLFDIEQVEVLRGPQGHLFGRNTVAGAVNITTRAPERAFDGYVRAVVGNLGVREALASVSGPLADKVLGKVSVASEARDGYTTNLYDGQPLDDLKRNTARAQVVFVASDKLKISLAADTSSGSQKTINGEPTTDLFDQPLTGGPLPHRRVNFDAPSLEKVDLSGGGATAHYTLAGGNLLTAIAGYRSTRQAKSSDNDYSPRSLLSTYFVDKFRQTSQELRIASPNQGAMRYVLGAYHLKETARTDRKATIGSDVNTSMVQFPGAPVLLPFGPVLGVLPGAVISNDGSVTTDTSALFGALDYDIAPSLTLNLGTRYTHETKQVLFNLDGSKSGAFGIATLAGYTDRRSENRHSPTVGATYALSKNQNLYAKYSRGFKSGGWNTEFLSANAAQNPSFDSESVDSYEAGTKGKLLAGRVSYDLAAYLSRFKNFQVFQFVDLGGGATSIELRNAASVESSGVEASLKMRVMPGLDIGASAGWVHARFKSFNNCSLTVDCTGHQLPYAPKLTSALTANYGAPLAGGGLDVYAEYSHHGKSYSDPVNDPASQAIPSRNQVNLRVAYSPENSDWNVSLWARNAFDSDTVITRGRDFLGNQIVRRMEPRTVGVELKYSL